MICTVLQVNERNRISPAAPERRGKGVGSATIPFFGSLVAEQMDIIDDSHCLTHNTVNMVCGEDFGETGTAGTFAGAAVNGNRVICSPGLDLENKLWADGIQDDTDDAEDEHNQTKQYKHCTSKRSHGIPVQLARKS